MSKLSFAIAATAGVSSVSGSVAAGSQGFLGFLQGASEIQHLSETSITHVNGLECTHILMDNKNVCVYPKAAFDFPELREAIPNMPALNAKCGEGFKVVAGYKLRIAEAKGEPEIRACEPGQKTCDSEGKDWDYIYAICAAPVHHTKELPAYRAVTSQGGATQQLACEADEHMAFGLSYRVAAERVVYSLDGCNNQACPETKEQLTGDRLSIGFCHKGVLASDRIPMKLVTAGPFFDVHEASKQTKNVSCGDNKDYFVAAGTLTAASLHWATDCFADAEKLQRTLSENVKINNPHEHESRTSCDVKSGLINYPMAMLLCGSNTLPDQIDPVYANSWNATFTNAYNSLANAAAGIVDQTYLAANDGYNYYQGANATAPVADAHAEEIVVASTAAPVVVETTTTTTTQAPVTTTTTTAAATTTTTTVAVVAAAPQAVAVEINAHAEVAPVTAAPVVVETTTTTTAAPVTTTTTTVPVTTTTTTTTLSAAQIAEIEAHKFVAENAVQKAIPVEEVTTTTAAPAAPAAAPAAAAPAF